MSRSGAPESIGVEALGGLGEMGHHHLALDLGSDSFVVDCGVLFAGPEDPGVEGIYPPLGPILERHQQGRLRALLLTHGHLDHIGAVPQLLRALPDLPVYGTPFTLRRLTERLNRDGPQPKQPPQFMPVQPGCWVSLGKTEVQWLSVTHSIPSACSVALRSSVGTVVHSGDFRLDATPLLGPRSDGSGLAALGEDGVDLALVDSTNAPQPGRTRSETELVAAFEALCKESPGRVVVCTFGSHLERVVGCAQAASATGRDFAVYGSSLESLLRAEREAGELDLGAIPLSTVQDVLRRPRNEQFLVVTGSQGEWRAAASRIANRTDPLLRLDPGDTFAFSARAIPGRERSVGYLVNALVEQGVDVLPPWSRRWGLHSSGHAHQEEIRQYLSWLRPSWVLPLHGEPWHLAEHRRFLETEGWPAERVLSLRSGQTLRLDPREEAGRERISAAEPPLRDKAQVGALLWDRDEPALRDRRKVARTGYACALVVVDAAAAPTICDLAVTTVGIFSRDRREVQEEELGAAVLKALGGAGRSRPRPEAWLEPARLALRRAIHARSGTKCLAEARVVRRDWW